jgi:hypothetical protein
MKISTTPRIEPDCRAVFLECGLHYGRCFGSKSNYARTNPGCIFIANACVYSRQQRCVWRGDLDLSDDDDVKGLIRASRLLMRKLYVLREQSWDQIPLSLRDWFIANTIVEIWHGQVTPGGDYRCLGGRFGPNPRMGVKTFNRQIKARGKSSGDTAKRSLREARVRNLAKAVFVGDAAISAWLRSPALALNGKCPIDLLETDVGARSVESLIRGIAYGNIV